jgi:hypothetical protein
MVEYVMPTSLYRFHVVLVDSYLDKELIYELGHCLDLSGDSHENEFYSSWIEFFLKSKIF